MVCLLIFKFDVVLCVSSNDRHKEKDEDFVGLCKTLQVTDSVCDQAWTFWKSVQKSIEDNPVSIKYL